jgi:hypothetical protein
VTADPDRPRSNTTPSPASPTLLLPWTPKWEEAAALRREQAAKQADLAAAELAKLSRRMVVQQHQQQVPQHQQPHGHSQGSAAGAATRAAAAAGHRASHGGAPVPAMAESGPCIGSQGAAAPAGGDVGVATTVAAAAAPSAAPGDLHSPPSAGAAAAAAGGSAGSSTGGGGGGFGGSLWSATLQYLAQFLLNRLQFSVRSVHIAFRVSLALAAHRAGRREAGDETQAALAPGFHLASHASIGVRACAMDEGLPVLVNHSDGS